MVQRVECQCLACQRTIGYRHAQVSQTSFEIHRRGAQSGSSADVFSAIEQRDLSSSVDWSFERLICIAIPSEFYWFVKVDTRGLAR